MAKTLLLQGIKRQKGRWMVLTLLLQGFTNPKDGQDLASVGDQALER